MERIFPFQRYRQNPILTKSDVPYACNTVFNAAACRFKDQYLLILRIEDQAGKSHFTLARSGDGRNFKIDPQPWVTPDTDPRWEPYERYGIEDPRVTRIGDEYFITYTAFGPFGPRVAIGKTSDFVGFERVSLATEVDNKDAVLFPERIRGDYVMLDRPSGVGRRGGSIWITYSPDLVHWGRARAILAPEPGWSNSRLGICTPPIRTHEGWLTLYHGVRETAGGKLYRMGVLLLDLHDPAKIVGYSPYFIFGPEEIYERVGDVPNVIFACGLLPEDDGTVKMYYGAADTCIALAEARLEDLVRICLGVSHLG
ncbi:MAG: glycoside hydrolase family 130 protein [Deltaproteobacteria bacterium]|nr:glycoside hydrolase family 130 protein [Deltaproteobacteria bacterium]MBW1922954.1 glycoside hydrolase family 130 protein [Deltaproteobacteria bacterium]MBW1950701.1 glycoside hydrolase family 130 protein [Deltaproteobacteria bacterium]MBW2008527.1 glycoside hydrolase family 130 protein [Deltaproteobacteria bacterium]MBW2101623.1 glycoside hydrolase family 130 protein [Deltaproteobacteria bacterium]